LIDKKVNFHIGEGSHCLPNAGIWHLIPETKNFKLTERAYFVDSSVPNFIEFKTSYVSLEGQFRFYQ